MAAEPSKWNVAPGANADCNDIPDTVDADSGLASLSAFFPQLTALPLSAGGRAPKREDFNGIFKKIAQWVYFYMQGGVPSWESGIAYTAGSFARHNGTTWTALKDSAGVKPAEGEYWHALSNFYTSNSLVNDLLNRVYPVGSIYMSAVNVSPASFLGGTWQAIEQGRMLMAAGSSWQAGTTGGAAYHALTVQEMPAHDHSAVETAAGGHTHEASTGSAGAHAHSGSALEAGAHAHNASTGTAGAHAHDSSMSTAGAHSHTGSTNDAGDHQHTGTTGVTGDHHHPGTTGASGAHSHSIKLFWQKKPGDGGICDSGSGQMAIYNFDTSTSGSHTHSFSTASAGKHSHSFSTTYAGVHSHSLSINTAGGHYHSLTISKAGDHAHSVTIASNGKHTHNLSIASAGAHTHSVAIAAAGAHTHAITIGKTGSGAAFSILPPYIAVYMWRRTA